ncbi:hypothetical protein BASA50_006564 [Batrachochytrium salamandrivorans]|uniref:Tim44-like domain-containing protein n=1 Tax=Batrachochytrium salamandrivorans TaxID=1357716 RepID=A0ABQ8F9T5_9FUNG|nr:hypothetical protein BASA62_009195 [Batrachochytrium salamandrivorans]KAH6594615.1 hypothetical protein BASA50_006564 [Batrachochytrium salamandrivorans]
MQSSAPIAALSRWAPIGVRLYSLPYSVTASMLMHSLNGATALSAAIPSKPTTSRQSPVRYSSSRSTTMRGRVIQSMIADPYIPPTSFPFPYNKANLSVLWERVKKAIFATWSGDRLELSKYVTNGLMTTLNPEMKAMKRLGTFVWSTHGTESRPRVLHLATAKVGTGDGELRLVQITVRVNVKQSMATYKGNTLVGGDPDNQMSVVEYIVLEKWLDGRWVSDPWKIAGKIQHKK